MSVIDQICMLLENPLPWVIRMTRLFEIARQFIRYCAFLPIAVATLQAPAFADQFDEKWQKARTYYVDMVNAGCAGDQDALKTLVHEATSPNRVRHEKSVAAHMVAWALHPTNSCPPWKEEQSIEKWRGWMTLARDGGYPNSLFSFGSSQVEGKYGINVDKTRGQRFLRMAEREGSSFAAVKLGVYHMASDHGFVPDKYFAEWYLARAEMLGSKSQNLPRLKENADKMPDVTTSAALLQRLQGRWGEGESGYFPYMMTVRGTTLDRNVARNKTAGELRDYQISVDHPSCPDHRFYLQYMWFDGVCHTLLFVSPNKLIISNGSTEKTWVRVY
ncbi:MAG: hypothetical protein AAGB07_15690 [Pseudomonadota bacterium]